MNRKNDNIFINTEVLMLSSISSMIEQFNQNNIKILKKIGCRLTIAANFKKGNTTDSATTSSFYNFLKKNSLNPIHLPIPRSINFFNIIKSFFLIRKLLKKYSFSLVHCYTPIAAMLIRVNSIFLKNKLNIIYTAHGFHFYNGAPILNWLVYFPIEKLLSKYVNILITINKEDFELGKRKFKNINNIFLVNGVGVNRKKFSPTDRKTKMELKKKFNVPSEDFIFLSVAEFNKNKNHKLILQFVKQLSKKIYNFKVFLVGIGPSFEKIVKLCKHLDLDKHVIFLGYRNDIEKLYKISDIFIATSKREGLPLSMIEAMTAGLPIIATKNRGHNSLINHGRNGYLYENNNPISFCQGALNLIQSKDTYNQISKNNISDSKIYSQEFIDIDMKNIYIKSLS